MGGSERLGRIPFLHPRLPLRSLFFILTLKKNCVWLGPRRSAGARSRHPHVRGDPGAPGGEPGALWGPFREGIFWWRGLESALLSLGAWPNTGMWQVCPWLLGSLFPPPSPRRAQVSAATAGIPDGLATQRSPSPPPAALAWKPGITTIVIVIIIMMRASSVINNE